jgi:short-subunit dehydrogenase
MDVLIFTTSVNKPEDVQQVQPILKSVQAIETWNFDLEDCDRILRVVSHDLPAQYIESLLNNAGYQFEELAY